MRNEIGDVDTGAEFMYSRIKYKKFHARSYFASINSQQDSIGVQKKIEEHVGSEEGWISRVSSIDLG